MKRFSSKLMSVLLVTMLIVSVIGCKSTPAPVDEVPAAAPVVTPEAPADTAKDEVKVEEKTPLVVEEVKEEVKAEEPKTEVKEEPKVEEAPAPVEEMVYPYGVEEIVKAEGNDLFDLFIVHTGDIQGSLEGSSESVGYARLKTMLDVARSITDNILLLDAGNTMAGSPLVDQYYGETAGVLLDALGYDAIGVAAKEFAYGLDRLVEASKLAKELSSIKVLSANALDSNDYLYFQPYQVYNYNGFKVAVVALTDFMDVDGVVFDSKVVMDNAQAAVQVARQYVDYVVVLGNFVANEAMAEPVIEYLGADLWIDGCAKDVPANGKMVGDTLYVQSGKNFSQVGVVDVLVKDGDVVSESAFAITAADVDAPQKSALASAYGIVAVPEDAAVKAYVDAKKATLKEEAPVVKEEAPKAPAKEEVKVEVKVEVKKAVVVKAPVKEEPKEIVYPYGVKEIVKAEGNDVFDLFIVHTNDVHGRLEGSSKVVGYARLSTMLQVARSITDNILLLDAGDAIQGTNIVNLYKGEPAAVLLDMLGYDAITLGNHEFDFGLERILEASKLAKQYSDVKVLSANTLDKQDRLLFQPYQVYNFNGFRVAVVGLTTPDTYVTTKPTHVEGLTFDSDIIINNAQAAVDMAHQYVDYVVVLGHVGMDENSPSGYNTQLILNNLDGVDLWIDGHSHTKLENGEYINDTLVVSTGEYMGNIGVVDVLVKDKEVVSETAFLISAADVDDPANSELASAYGITAVPEDPKVKAYIDSKKEELTAIYDVVIADVPMTLKGERADVRTKKTNLTKMICEAMTASANADFTITNGGGIRASIEAGEVTKGEVITVLPFNNVVTTVELTGAEVYEAMEYGYRALPDATGSYAQTDLKVIYNKYAEPGKRIIRLYTPDGKKIEKDAVYQVATNDFLAVGGDGYEWFTDIISYGQLMSDVLEEYLTENYPVK